MFLISIAFMNIYKKSRIFVINLMLSGGVVSAWEGCGLGLNAGKEERWGGGCGPGGT